MGKMRKLSRPWFGPYRVCSRDGPDVTITHVYRPGDPIQVHLTRVVPCPPHLLAGFYWYGSRCRSPGNPPQMDALLCTDQPLLPSATGLTAGESCQSSSGATDISGSETHDTRQDKGPRCWRCRCRSQRSGVYTWAHRKWQQRGEMTEDSTPCGDEVGDLERVTGKPDYCMEDTASLEMPEVVTGRGSVQQEKSHARTHSDGCLRRQVLRWLPPSRRKPTPCDHNRGELQDELLEGGSDVTVSDDGVYC